MGRTKFNVDKETDTRTCDGIVFDSRLEMRYYSDVVLPGVENGEIKRWRCGNTKAGYLIHHKQHQ